MKTNNPSLAKTTCNGCNGQADIKQKKTGKKLLYLHCKNCGLDQRSGNFLQLKWQHAIDGISEIDIEQLTEIVSEITEITTETISEITPKLTEKEWQPAIDTEKVNDNDEFSGQTRQEPERENETSQGNSWGKWLTTVIAFGVVIARIRA